MLTFLSKKKETIPGIHVMGNVLAFDNPEGDPLLQGDYVLDDSKVVNDGTRPITTSCGAPAQLRITRDQFLDFVRDGRVGQPYIALRAINWLKKWGWESAPLHGGGVLIMGPEGEQSKDGTGRRKWAVKALTDNVEFGRSSVRGIGRESVIPTTDFEIDGWIVGDLRDEPKVKLWWFTAEVVEALEAEKIITGGSKRRLSAAKIKEVPDPAPEAPAEESQSEEG